jgi:hypothetical protein
MMIIGCDYHPSWQQICWMDTVTGETGLIGRSRPDADRGSNRRIMVAV